MDLVPTYGDWQNRGPDEFSFRFFCEKGQATLNDKFGTADTLVYKDTEGVNYEKDGFISEKTIENLNTPRNGQGIILDMVKNRLTRKEIPTGTNFAEAFKSFAVSMAAIESSRTGNAIWVPSYWEDMPVYQKK